MVANATPFEALKAAVDRSGSQSEFGRLCGVSQTAVWKWLQSSKRLPAEHVLAVEAATGVSRHDLRPDIYPRGLKDGVPFSFAPSFDFVAPAEPVVACDNVALLQAAEAA